ncbi:MAG: hypothetical protein J0H39_21200 [Alphaproteobacteria bacterium]|nr:hypothetical protein [Alphaproteobacteria bacterium]
MRRFLVLVTAAFLATATAPAWAEDTRPNSTPPKANPDADKLNARNPNVFHAGPGKPLEGSVYVSPSRIPKPDAKK